MKASVVMIGIAALMVPGLVSAQTSSMTDERRLTPEQVEAVLAEVEAKRTKPDQHVPAADAPIDDAEAPPAPQVHGEMGFSIGTGGYREIFGTAIYPLPGDGIAAISLDFVDLGRRRYPR